MIRIVLTVNSDSELDLELLTKTINDATAVIRHRRPNTQTTIKTDFTPRYIRDTASKFAMPSPSFVSYAGMRRPHTGPRRVGAKESSLIWSESVLTGIQFESMDEAISFRSKLSEIVDNHKFLTVLDLLDAIGITGAFEDAKLGWTDISEFKFEGDTKVTFPKPELLMESLTGIKED